MARSIIPPSIRIGVQTLRSNPLRTVLSTLGVIMGVASLVAVLAIGDGVEAFARDQIERTTDLQTVGIAPRTSDVVDGLSIPRSDWPELGLTDVEAFRDLLGIRGAVSIMARGRAVVRAAQDDSARAALVFATDSLGMTARGGELAHGRGITAADLADSARILVVSDRLARALLPEADPAALVGRTVQVQETPFRVVGVLAPLEMDVQFNIGAVPFTTADAALAQEAGPTMAVLSAHLARIEDADSVRAEVERWAEARWDGGVQIQAGARERLKQVKMGMLIFKIAMGSFATIAILVGGIGIMNVLLASVFERTREIGVRKATGARNRDILAQFLAESVAITGAGSALGTVLGLAGAFAATAIMRAQTDAPVYAAVTIPSLGVAVLVAIVTGLAFGSYPAMRAARLSPIDAIRHE